MPAFEIFKNVLAEQYHGEGVKPFPVLDGPESVVALPPPREIPETVRGLVRRHGRRG